MVVCTRRIILRALTVVFSNLVFSGAEMSLWGRSTVEGNSHGCASGRSPFLPLPLSSPLSFLPSLSFSRGPFPSFCEGESQRLTDRQTDRDKVGGKGVGTGGSRRLLNIRLLDVKWMIPKAELECDF